MTYEDMSSNMNLIVLSLVCIYLLFNSGENVTTEFEKFNDELYQSDWYLFPTEMQKMFVTFMSYSQRSMTVQGYGHNLAQCTRETFKKVMTRNEFSMNFLYSAKTIEFEF